MKFARYLQTTTLHHTRFHRYSRLALRQTGQEIEDWIEPPTDLWNHLTTVENLGEPLLEPTPTPVHPNNRLRLFRQQLRAHSDQTALIAEFLSLFPEPVYTQTVKRHIMGDVAKTFSDIEKLNADGSNYRAWISRIRIAAKASGGRVLLTRPPDAGDDDEISLNDQLFAAIINKLPNTIFVKVMSLENTSEVLSVLERDYNVVTHAVEAVTEAKLYSLRCTDERQINKHLDAMLDIRSKMGEYGRVISDETFINAISASIPESYRDVITNLKSNVDAINDALRAQIGILNTNIQANQPPVPAGQQQQQQQPQLIAVSTRTVTATEVINALRAKAASKAAVSGSKSRDEQANYSSWRGGGHGRGRGRGRGRGGGRGGY